MAKETVIVIGAGAAGLMAALELADKFDIIILEGRNRTGGRINSVTSSHTHNPIEAGAEFIHGNLPLTFELLKQAGISYTKLEGKFYRKANGQFTEQTEMIEGWDQLLKTMKGLKEDMTMADFLDLHYPGAEHKEFRDHVIAYTQGFDIADENKASVQGLYKEWSHEEEGLYRIPQGYSALINFLEEECTSKRCRIVLNQTVKQIDWEKNDVTVYTSDKQTYYAQKVVITIPVSILSKTADTASINFTPPLDAHIKAATQIGTGEVVKAVLHFNKRFWKEDTGFVLSDENFPTWWTQLPDTTPVLTGWAGGPKAQRLGNLADDEILQEALQSLSAIFEIPVDELKSNLEESHLFNWQKEEYSLGAYSYSMPASPIAKKILNTAAEDTIYFAGEAFYEGNSPGTVEAALVSGKETAKIINSIQQPRSSILHEKE